MNKEKHPNRCTGTGVAFDKRTRGGGQDFTSQNVHDFHRQGTRPINKKEGSTR